MASKKQIEANRRNSLHSTGPKSDAGKAASSMNALKTGLYAKSLVLPTERAADLETLIAEYYDQFQPETPELRDLVDEYISLVWQLRRLGVTEVQIYKHEQAHIDRYEKLAYPQGQIASNNFRAFESLQRRTDSTRRHRDRVRESIRRLRAEQVSEAAQAHRAAESAAASSAASTAVSTQPASDPGSHAAAIPLTRNPLPANWLRSVNHPADSQAPSATGDSETVETAPPTDSPRN